MSRFMSLRCRRFLLTFLYAAAVSASAQSTIHGYVTAFRSSADFDVEGARIAALDSTAYTLEPGKRPSAVIDVKSVLGLGAYLTVRGKSDDSAGRFRAESIALRDETQDRIVAFSVVQSIAASGTEKLVDTDGYRLRINSSTKLEFREGLASLDDVVPGVWIRFEGYHDASGVVLAQSARFAPGLAGRRKQGPPPQESAPVAGSYLDADGRILPPHTKVRLSKAAGLCGWHRIPDDPALQERILRLADRLIPAYQRTLPNDARARIPFRFYAVDEPDARDDTLCNSGLVLIPAQAAARLQKDDQLAALIADGIAGQMLLQRAELGHNTLISTLGSSAEIAAAVINPWSALAMYGITAAAAQPALKRFQQEGARVSLDLMANAGFDPWQAAEARRLLGPKRLPRDTAGLPYPDSGLYLLGILYVQHASGPPLLRDAR
jgi:hypothetical protein